MFTSEALSSVQKLNTEGQKHCQEQYGESEAKATTESGIEVKPVYTPLDIQGMNFEEIGLPGEYPYTRGRNPLMYQVEPWQMRFLFGYGAGKESRDRWEFLKEVGMNDLRPHEGIPNFNMAVDLPTHRGYDPDAPEAQTRVGECGVSVSSIREFEGLLDGIPLDKVRLSFICDDPTMVLLAMYITYAERRGYPLEKLEIWTINRLYRQWCWDVITFPPDNALRLMVENMYFMAKHFPKCRSLSIGGYLMGETGANAVQEVAFTLSLAICVTEECIRVGLNPDDFVSQIYAHSHLGMDLFEEISKLRALRRMWAKIFKERFGCQNPQALTLRNYPQTGGSFLPALEPENNIIRAAIMTLVGVLAGVDSICTSGYDEALNIPSEEAVKIAIRTQQIIYHETNIPNVTDPLGGSYYVEHLTNEIERKAWELLTKIEELGGCLECWKSGWFRKEEARTAQEHQVKVEDGEKVIVGVNKYALEEPTQGFSATFKVDPNVEKEAVERVKKFRAERDSEKTKAALARLQQATEDFVTKWPDSCGSLMPALIDTARADATLGEMCQVLQRVCGYVYAY